MDTKLRKILLVNWFSDFFNLTDWDQIVIFSYGSNKIHIKYKELISWHSWQHRIFFSIHSRFSHGVGFDALRKFQLINVINWKVDGNCTVYVMFSFGVLWFGRLAISFPLKVMSDLVHIPGEGKYSFALSWSSNSAQYFDTCSFVCSK